MTEKSQNPSKRKPSYCELRAGQVVLWCACGQSTNGPFCDGKSHLGSGKVPVRYRAQADEEVLFCECKHTATPPFCDGTHSNLPGGYADAPETVDAEAMPLVPRDSRGISPLDDSCYVVSPGSVPPSWESETVRIRPLVTRELGASHQSQFHVALDKGRSPLLSAAGDTVVWIAGGKGRALVGDTAIEIPAMGGLHIGAGVPFAFEGDEIEAYVSVCPAVADLEVDDTAWSWRDAKPADDLRTIDEAARVAMGPRYFQVLMDDRDGLDNAAQFIGHIPLSRADMHRHLYEEALIIVSGEGMIHNPTCRAVVGAGDVIFFPRKVVHSLECTASEGMDVVGFIYPGTNPGINY
ncbi:cupin domain-containing protein [Novosphingobium aquimarinum]|uniref:cupin domain-containing protein n=1 Tax=Novosphingobium aquimarinum TaxID=2682494 RepID=UPI0012EBCBB2|nr:cupin domain-containing protein [Novosphingobium aquimarinum]